MVSLASDRDRSMNCSDIKHKISDWLDGGLVLSEESSVQAHLKICSDCSVFYEEIRIIKINARNLDPLEPPSHLWANLQAQLIAEEMVKGQERLSFWERFLPLRIVQNLKPALSGAILALILAGSFFYIYQRHHPDENIVSSETEVIRELRQAETHYQKAIQALNEDSRRKIETLDPAMAQILNDNLATMDYYLKECNDAVQSNPDNPLVHRYLLTAYQKKIEIMQSIVDSDIL